MGADWSCKQRGETVALNVPWTRRTVLTSEPRELRGRGGGGHRGHLWGPCRVDPPWSVRGGAGRRGRGVCRRVCACVSRAREDAALPQGTQTEYDGVLFSSESVLGRVTPAPSSGVAWLVAAASDGDLFCSDPEATVKTGRLRGKTEYTPAGTKYHAFLGIPYAKPPVGPLRFKAPEPAEPWTGVRDASRVGNTCPQKLMLLSPEGVMARLKFMYGLVKMLPNLVQRTHWVLKQSEDCLYLNVYTPADAEGMKARPLRPVLFWIHGGGFQIADANPDLSAPELFLDKDVVVVTFNYRLGPLGFLSLGNADVPGNAGLKDQALALRWTRDNIRAFGGDPDAITLFGESAGGVSAHYMQVSPLCKGMFRGVIASSGNALLPWGHTTHRYVDVARALAKALGVPDNGTLEELAAALRGVNANKLCLVAARLERVFDTAADQLMFLPVVEPEGPGAFLTELPEEVFAAGRHHDVPLMTGVSTGERFGLLICTYHAGCSIADGEENEFIEKVNHIPAYFLPNDLYAALEPEQRKQCNRELVEHYVGDKPFTREVYPEFLELWGDSMFMSRVPLAAHMNAAHSKSPVYVWRFSFVGKNNLFKWILSSRFRDCRPIEGDRRGEARRAVHGVRRGGPACSACSASHSALHALFPVAGVAHGDFLCYICLMRLLPGSHMAEGSREDLCRKRLVDVCVNFVKWG
ncbi:hypothetical protein ONE63_001236 [Megalurothrips usitatus]|uniref:Carboxylic ester hydrolase n=1 Tax=Megalurothrips usitatus TaxID=439358 RepID=A0AAV7XBF4_9NEOP|nr:hypothetical protein ONE63_001236 [Megalurothrips usitatus]